MRLSCSWLPANRDWELSADVGLAGARPSRPLVRVYWRLFKPQCSLDGLRSRAGMPLQEARPHPGPIPQERELNCDPGAGRARGLAEMPKEARPHPVPLPQERESNGIKPDQGKSSQIKVNQACEGGGEHEGKAEIGKTAKSSLRGWGGGKVVSGWWRKRRNYCGCATYACFRGYGLAGMPKQSRPHPVPLPQERESNGIKANQAKSSQIKVNQGKSSLRGWGGGRNWTCRWRKRVAEYSLVKPQKIKGSQALAPPESVKPGQTRGSWRL